MWSDDDWLKKFSGKPSEAEAEAAGGETTNTATQEVKLFYLSKMYWCFLFLTVKIVTGHHFVLQDQPPAKKGRVNPQVYMDIKIGNKPAGRLRFLLRADIVPMTAGLYHNNGFKRH